MERLDQALAMHRAGRLDEAETLYRQILAAQPNHPRVLQLLGVIIGQKGDLQMAANVIGQAADLDPENAECQTNLGEVLRRQGRLPEAIACFRRATELAPENGVAHFNLGLALTHAGRREEAIAAFRRVAALDPKHADALCNLGVLLLEARRDEEAVRYFEKARALRPAAAEIENAFGQTLWNLQRHEEAAAAFTRATALKPDFVSAHASRARALRKIGRVSEALASFQAVARLDPASADAQHDLAMSLIENGAWEAAIAPARRAAELAPEQAEALHALGVVLGAAHRAAPATHPVADAIAAYERALALRRAPEWEFELAVLRGVTPHTAPNAYVQILFDEYAPRFEQHLVDGLKYRVPEQLLEAVKRVWQAQDTAPQNLDILDLGTGTGRAGAFFRPHARTLVGVDLAPNMIARAQARRDPAGRPVFDRLITAPILPALAEFEMAFDLIVAADVFIYVGSLDEVFPAVARALRPRGLLAFSLERYDPPAPEAAGFDFHLRYRHSLEYVRRLAQAAQLVERAANLCPLRNDVPPGWLVILQRP
jgi:predicted TPR repeat methyltransferase